MALNATILRHERESDDDYVVMAHPEGNLFCFCLDDGLAIPVSVGSAA